MRQVILMTGMLFFAVLACDSSSALVNFADSGCKKGQSSALTAGYAETSHALLATDAAQYNGLTCLSWDATGTTLKIDCLNFGGGCGVKWQGEAEVADGNAVKLFANHEPEDFGGEIGTSCAQAACGSCIYDWSFEIKGIDASKNSPLTLTEGGSCASRTDTYTTTLPLASKKKSAVCRYAEYGLLTWAGGSNGTINMPCRGVPCDDGLACTKMPDDLSENAAICLKTCTADADCPLDGLLKCTEGLCKLAETW